MESYQEKIERKKARYAELAELAKKRAGQAWDGAEQIQRYIPLGQPILLGHHSERRHRKDIERIHRLTRKSIELDEMAKHYEAKAKNYKSYGISSDNPEACEELEAKIKKLEDWQAMIKEANKLWKKQDIAGLKALGFTDHQIETQKLLMARRSWECHKMFPAYETTNNAANIRRLKERLKTLETKKGRESQELEFGQIKVVENIEQNRIQIFFPDKPAESVRTELKANGFRWAPTEGAWQRHHSDWALILAKKIAEKGAN